MTPSRQKESKSKLNISLGNIVTSIIVILASAGIIYVGNDITKALEQTEVNREAIKSIERTLTNDFKHQFDRIEKDINENKTTLGEVKGYLRKLEKSVNELQVTVGRLDERTGGD